MRRLGRPLAVALALAAVAGVAVATPGPAAAPASKGEPVVVFARDLPAGARLGAADVAMARVPPDRVPAGAVRRITGARGHTLAGPVRRGEALTDRRLLGPALLAGYGSGDQRFVAVPVRIADAAVIRLLRPGDRVDVMAGPVSDSDGEPAGGPADVVAAGASVLAVPGTARRTGQFAPAEGALVVLAVPQEVAAALAGAMSASRHLVITLR